MKRTRPIRRFFLRWLSILAGLYLAVVISAMLFENSLIFVGAGKHWVKPGERFVETPIDLPDGTATWAWWLPNANGPTENALVFFCGNGDCASRAGRLAEQIQKRFDGGILLVDYPGYGKNNGSPSESGCYANASAGIDWLIREKGIPAERIVVMGQSLGGGVAVEMATRYPVRAVVLVSSYTSLPDVAKAHFPFLPVQWLMRNRFDNLSKIVRVTAPVFVVHGTSDRTIPHWQGETLFAAANEPKQFLRMEGLGHNECLCESMLRELAEFLKRNP